MTSRGRQPAFWPSNELVALYLEDARASLRQLKGVREEDCDGEQLTVKLEDSDKDTIEELPFDPEAFPLPSADETREIIARHVKAVLLRAINRRRYGLVRQDFLGQITFIPEVADALLDGLPIQPHHEWDFTALVLTEVKAYLNDGGSFEGPNGRIHVFDDKLQIQLADGTTPDAPPRPHRARRTHLLKL